MTPAVPGDGAAVEALRSRLESSDLLAARARRELEDVQAEGQIVEVRVADHLSGPISTTGQLDATLAAIRAEAEAAFDAGKEVRLV